MNLLSNNYFLIWSQLYLAISSIAIYPAILSQPYFVPDLVLGPEARKKQDSNGPVCQSLRWGYRLW